MFLFLYEKFFHQYLVHKVFCGGHLVYLEYNDVFHKILLILEVVCPLEKSPDYLNNDTIRRSLKRMLLSVG